jgi:iron-sulfur cluster assembly protein
MSIQLTESAARRVQQQLQARGRGLGLRVGIKASGCSGYAYVLDYADEAAADEVVFESHGARVFVPRDALAMLDGLVVDFRREGLNEVFKFDNPNAEALCGCGESFSVEKNAA